MVRCIYCGSQENITKEHIPPKSLFTKPRPSNLITVPACRKCNNGLSHMDEHFKFLLTIEYKVGRTIYAKENLPSVVRGMSRPQKRRFINNFYSQGDDVLIKNMETGKVEESRSFKPDSELMNNRIESIVKGLFYYHTGKHCYHRYLISVYWLNYQMTDDWKYHFRHLDNLEWNIVGGSVFTPIFAYKYKIIGESDTSWWRINLFKHQKFGVLMRKKFDVEI